MLGQYCRRVEGNSVRINKGGKGKIIFMKALFINPPIYDFSTYDLWMKPLGFLYLVDLFKKNGWETYYFDFMDRNHPFYDDIKRKEVYGCGKFYSSREIKPSIYKDVPRIYRRFGLPLETFISFKESIPDVDFIFITSGMTYWYKGVEEVINFCRENFPNTPIVLGGTYVNFCLSHAKTLGVDFLFSGKNLSNFCKEFSNHFNVSLKYYNQLSPDWSVYKKLSYLCLKTSSGCPFNCYYCGTKKVEPTYLPWDIDTIVDETLESLNTFNINDIAFYDDALLFNFKRHLEVILKKLNGNKRNLRFHTPNGLHSKFINRETSALLKEYGFKTLRLSLESVFSFRAEESSYKTTFTQFENALNLLLNAGFNKENIGVYILLGLPEQKPEEVIESIKILKGYSCKIKLAEYSPIPGTFFYEMSEKIYPQLPLSNPLFQNNSIVPLWQFDGKWDILNYIKQQSFPVK